MSDSDSSTNLSIHTLLRERYKITFLFVEQIICEVIPASHGNGRKDATCQQKTFSIYFNIQFCINNLNEICAMRF